MLDGQNRLDALELTTEEQFDRVLQRALEDAKVIYGDPCAFVISANIHRRHLSPSDKDRLILQVLKLKPEIANRAVANAVKVDHHKVARVRAEGERVGKIPHADQRTDAVGRLQPASKPPQNNTGKPRSGLLEARLELARHQWENRKPAEQP